MTEQVDLVDSNLANYGGVDHRKAAKAAAQREPEWKGAGCKAGLEIWRVENRRTVGDLPDFGIKRWPKEQYGEFFDGDSYIVLNTYKLRDPVTGKPGNKLAYDVHFWLGKDSTEDERGVAAYKTTELDDLLDDLPVQHREIMNNESPLFMSYFKKGIQYLSGGVDSGFRKVKPHEYKPRLIEVKKVGKSVRAYQEEKCHVEMMNLGDSYIVDAGRSIYKYFGPESCPFEKAATAALAANMANGRDGKSRVVDADEDMWNILGGTEADLASVKDEEEKLARTPPSEQAFAVNNVVIYQICDESGRTEFTKVEMEDEKGYLKCQLDTNDVFVVDSGISIFMWRGKDATKNEKSQAWKLISRYMKENNRPETLPITVIDEGKISSSFDSCFAN